MEAMSPDCPKSDVGSRWILICILLGALVFAWHNRFIQDDAFISFRYAQNLVEGKGLVWNEEDRVEGYTNFLWTLLLAVPHLLGLDPVGFVMGLGMISFFICLCITYKAALVLSGSHSTALLSVLLLGSNYTFSSFATGGMETEMQACLLMASLLVFLLSNQSGSWTRNRLVSLSLLTALCLLTRMDSAVVSIPLLLLAIFVSLSGSATWRQRISRISLLAIPAVIIVGFWLVWKVLYYGDILPNTYYLKVASETSFERGARYVFDFLVSYWLVPFVMLFVVLIGHSINRTHKEIYLVAVLAILWCGYVIGIGGDFMEFRLMVPSLPFLAIIVAWVTVMLIKYRVAQAALILVALCGSVYHGLTFEWDGKFGPESIRLLKKHLASDGGNWIEIGRSLGRELDFNPSVIIGTGASGAIPYYSRLRTIDLFGLNDEEIAKHGATWTHVPGHQRLPYLSDLVYRRVNLIIGGMNAPPNPANPDIIFRFDDMKRWPAVIAYPQDIPAGSCIVDIPTPDGRTFSVWYLVKSQFIDDRIRERKWKTHPIVAGK